MAAPVCRKTHGIVFGTHPYSDILVTGKGDAIGSAIYLPATFLYCVLDEVVAFKLIWNQMVGLPGNGVNPVWYLVCLRQSAAQHVRAGVVDEPRTGSDEIGVHTTRPKHNF